MVNSHRADAFSPAQVLAMERAAARAWPAGETADVDGWVWRTSGGGSRRANSVLPLAYTGADVDASLTHIEQLYGARGLRTYFQVSSISQPPDLDARLEQRGYVYEEPVLLMAKQLHRQQALPANVEVTAEPTPDWLSVYSSTIDVLRRDAVPTILARVPEVRGFFVARRDGQALAAALCVVSPDGVAVIECVATEATRRRSGAARTVMDALEIWAADRGARVAALQVAKANTPARSLYDARGYRTAGRYHYRWRDV